MIDDSVINGDELGDLVSELERIGFRSDNPNGMTFAEAVRCVHIRKAVSGDIDSYKVITSTGKSGSPLYEYLNANGIEYYGE